MQQSNTTFAPGTYVRRVFGTGKASVGTYLVRKTDEQGVWIKAQGLGRGPSAASIKAYRADQLVAVTPAEQEQLATEAAQEIDLTPYEAPATEPAAGAEVEPVAAPAKPAAPERKRRAQLTEEEAQLLKAGPKHTPAAKEDKAVIAKAETTSVRIPAALRGWLENNTEDLQGSLYRKLVAAPIRKSGASSLRLTAEEVIALNEEKLALSKAQERMRAEQASLGDIL